MQPYPDWNVHFIPLTAQWNSSLHTTCYPCSALRRGNSSARAASARYLDEGAPCTAIAPDFSGPWHFRAQPRCSYLWRECITPTPECEHRRPPLAVKVNRKNCGRPLLTFENQLRADSGPGVAQCSYQSTDRQVIADTGAVSDHAPECWEVIFDKLRGRQLDPEAETLSVNSRLVDGHCASRAYQSSDRYLIAILCPITVWNVRRHSQLQPLS